MSGRLHIAIVLAGGLLASTAIAHHAAQVTYQTDQIVEVEGEITDLTWRNPHVRFSMSVTDADGQSSIWNIESIPVTRLTRVGVSEDLIDVGQRVRIAGFPSKRSATEAYAINLLLEDGREVLLDTPDARWSGETLGTGLDLTPGARGADASLGIFRVWSTDGVFLGLGSMGEDLGFSLTEAGLAAQAAWDPLSPDNPFRGCSPKGMPGIMEQPNPMEFVDQGDDILVRLEEYDTVRVIRMNGTAADDPAPTLLGHSSGRWEGGTLVVETDRIDWEHFNQNGLKQSEDMHIVERFTPSADGARLDYELTITDPALFTEPETVTKSWIWVPGDQVLPFDCVE
jgi:hypothetical protein